MRGTRFFSTLRRKWREKPDWLVPLALFLATCVSTTFVGYIMYGDSSLAQAFWFSAPLMTILTVHELGHYLQLRRLRVRSSFPYFIPLPLPPLGTMGAVIRIRERLPDRRALFDMGLSGPVAGLVAALCFLVLGLFLSTTSVLPPCDKTSALTFGAPLVMQWLARAILGDGSDGARFVLLHPCAIAGWTGLFVTSLNLMPVAQLDGGHVIYALLRKRSTVFSYVVLAIVCVVAAVYRFWGWFLFVALLVWLGFKRQPTLDDSRPLGTFRVVCGILALAYLPIGFSPRPVIIDESPPESARVAVESEPPSGSAPLVFHIGLQR